MNRSDHWQNLARLGELLLTPGSTLTLNSVYHPPPNLSLLGAFGPATVSYGCKRLLYRRVQGLIGWRVAMLHDCVPNLLARSTELLEREFGNLPTFAAARRSDADIEAMAAVLEETAQRLGDNYPYFHPLYAGQMLKPPHPVARAAYALAMTVNPNNHARDGGRASSAMEIEAVAEIGAMFGWSEFLGHLTSGGTMANLEALWVSGQVCEGSGRRRIVGSEQAHYTHRRISAVLKLDYSEISADRRGRMDMDALEVELRKGDVGTVVA